MQLTKSQITGLNEVRDLINSSPERRFQINQLRLMCNLSEDKLTKGFKMLFGETIYKYQLRVSMEYGRTLLQKGYAVKSVSITLGYKTPGNFTRAFLKIFKYPPVKIKNEVY